MRNTEPNSNKVCIRAYEEQVARKKSKIVNTRQFLEE